MQYSRLIILITLITLTSCAENKYSDVLLLDKAAEKKVELTTLIIDKDSLYLNVNNGISSYNSETFSGKAVSYLEGRVIGFQEYKDGRKHGKSELSYKNGSVSYEARYVAGRLNGTSKSWWKNGNLRSISNHKGGVLNGNQKQYYQSGVLFKERNIAEGKEEGMQKSWRENGKLYNNYEAKNGRIFGLKRSSLCFKLEDEIVQYKN